MLKECNEFATEIVVSFGSARYDGATPEPDISEMWGERDDMQNVSFVKYEVTKEIELNPLLHRPHAFWHNISRIAGVSNLKSDADWILFLDGDEIPDGLAFKQWLETTALLHGCSYKLANYWYFRDVTHQARQWEDSVILVSRTWFSKPDVGSYILMQDNERDAIFQMLPGERNIVHPVTKRPMFHHFSWVRSKQAMLAKVQNWGHRDDKDWKRLIEDAWEKPFDGTDFVHGYDYVTVENVFSIDVDSLPDA
ncbi:hypothetical protein EBT31_21430 [bacterium]|nr:hypothetical protein [bacterium]